VIIYWFFCLPKQIQKMLFDYKLQVIILYNNIDGRRYTFFNNKKNKINYALKQNNIYTKILFTRRITHNHHSPHSLFILICFFCER